MLRPITSYDAVPYLSTAIPQTAPDRLAALARLFGLHAPDVTRCRVLELGAASGGNLLPMAFDFPRSEFVGVDLSRQQVREGRRTLAALGLRNVRLEHTSLADIGRSWGWFDYVICHGVFSWVERHVQDRIVDVIAGRLSPNGIAYVSYNTYPGWHLRGMVRDMLRYHAARFDTASEQVAQARALLAFVAAAADTGIHGELLRREADRLAAADDSYVFHEHLEQANTPVYFHEFVDRAERAGLQFLGEADVSEMLTTVFPPDVAATLEQISPDIVHLEQYMDFIRNRQFRQTLLCRRERPLSRQLSPAALDGLFVSADVTAQATDNAHTGATTFASAGRRATVSAAATQAALIVLAERWPEAVAVDALCEIAIARIAPDASAQSRAALRETVLTDLLGCVMHGLVRLHTHPPACTADPGERPLAYRPASFLAARDALVVNARHEPVPIDPLAATVLTLANGRRTRRQMLAALRQRLRAATVPRSPGAPSPRRWRIETLADALDAALDDLARRALLVAPPPRIGSSARARTRGTTMRLRRRER